MADILKEIDQGDKVDKELSLKEVEKAFDDITKDAKDDKDQIKKLVEALTTNLEKKEYIFDYQSILEEIIKKDGKLSKMDKNTIKVYQLCKNLESKKATPIEIDGKVGPEMIYDRLVYFNTQEIGLIVGLETIAFDKEIKKFSFTTQFGTYEQSLDDATLTYKPSHNQIGDVEDETSQIANKMLDDMTPSVVINTVVDDVSYCKDFINEQRQVQFNSFLTTNKITLQDRETITLSEDKIIAFSYKNAELEIDTSSSMDISCNVSNADIIKFIEEGRKNIEIKKVAAEEKKMILSMPGKLLDLAKKGDDLVYIETKDIEAALKDGFFDEKTNITGLIKELDDGINPLKEKFLTSLKLYKGVLITKDTEELTSAEIKLLQLYANYELGYKFKVDGKISTELSDVMALKNNKYVENIKNILLKNDQSKVSSFKVNLLALNLGETTITELKLDDITKFININIDDYTVEQQEKILLNIQYLLLDWNSLFPNKTARVNSATLTEIKQNSDYQEKENKIYEAMVLDKEKFREGTVTFSDFNKKYQPIDASTNKPIEWTKYDNNPFYTAFKKLLVTLCPSNGTSVDLTPLYKNRATKGTTFLKSPLFLSMEGRSSDVGGTLEINKGNIWQTLYYEFIGYAVKDVLVEEDVSIVIDEKTPPTKVKTQIIKEDYYRKYTDINLNPLQEYIFANTTYGKSLKSASDVWYIDHFSNKDTQEKYDASQKMIKNCADIVASLEDEVTKWETLRVNEPYAMLPNGNYKLNEEKYIAKRDAARKKLVTDGNRAFLGMVLQLPDLSKFPTESMNSLGSPEFISLILQHQKAYYNSQFESYTGPKKLPAPIGGGDGGNGCNFDYTMQRNAVNTGIVGARKAMLNGTNKTVFYPGDSEWLDGNVDEIMRAGVFDSIEDVMIDIDKHPEKFLIDVGIIVAAGAITSLTGGIASGVWGVLLQAGVFTAATKTLYGVVSSVEEVNKGGSGIEGFKKGIGVSDQEGNFVGRSDLAENLAWEYVTNVILFGPVGKLGGVAERGALNLIEKETAIKGAESMIAKFGLEKVGAKTFGLLSEAGIFTGFNAVMGSARAGFSKESWEEAMKVEGLAAGFVHNIMFISALKLGNFTMSGFQEKIAGKQITKANKDAVTEVKKLNKDFDVKIEKLKTENGIECFVEGETVVFKKAGKIITEIELSKISNGENAISAHKKLLIAQNKLVNIQIQITTKTQEFTKKPEVKKYNNFLDANDLRRETITPENVIDLRIKAAEKAKDVTKVKELKELEGELNIFQKEYNTILNETIKLEIETIKLEIEPVKIEPVKIEPVKIEPVKIETVKIEPVTIETAIQELVKIEPVKIEPVKIEPEIRKTEEVSEKVRETYDDIINDLRKKADAGIDVEKNMYIIQSMENLSQTSRTAKGVLDTSASENKKFKFEDITPENAGIKALENFQKLSEYIYDNRNIKFESVAEVRIFVEKIAKEANAGILKPEYFIRDENPDVDVLTGKPKYAYTDKNGMSKTFEQFCQEFYDKINNPAIDPMELAAWVEYRVNLKDHFFADGCGKTSILLSNFILMRNNLTLPEIRGEGKERFKYSGKTQRDANSPEYNPDLETWTEYYKTQFIMENIYSKTIAEMDAYIKEYNESGKGIKGKIVIIGEYNDNIILINEKGELRRIETDNSKALKENIDIKYINPDFTKMSGEEIHEYAIEHRNEIIKQYQQDNPNDKFLVDVDMFRRYLGGEKGISPQNTHEGASFLADSYFDWLIENNKGLDGFNNTIRFLAGGPGSGKSLASEIEKNEFFNGILDGTFKTYKNAARNIERALANGFDVKVDFVGRNMNDAWNEGVMKRTVEQNIFDGIKEKIPNTDIKNIKIESLSDLLDSKYSEAFGGKYKEVFGENYENIATYISYTGRTVPIGVFYEGHSGSRSTLAQLHEKYPTNLRFTINGEKNVGIKSFMEFINSDKFDIDQGGYTVESALNNGFISEGQAKDLMIGYEKTQMKIGTNTK